MTHANKFFTLALLCLSAFGSLFAKEITVLKHVGKAIENLNNRIMKNAEIELLNNDFKTIAEGIKNDKWTYSEDTYNNAIECAVNATDKKTRIRSLLKRNAKTITAKLNEKIQKARTVAKKPKLALDITNCQPITQADIDDLNGEPFLLTSGAYCLQEDIVFTPTAEESFAFLTDGDNITLDLGGHTLRQSNETQDIFTVIGVGINAGDHGHHNISIQNGTITNFQGTAIYSFVPETFPQIAIDTLSFNNLRLINNGDGVQHDQNLEFAIVAEGINLFSGFDDFPQFQSRFGFSNITIQNCKINKNTLTGIFAAAANGIVIENTQANGTTQNIGDFGPTAYLLYECINVTMNNCTGNNTAHTDSDALFSAPISILASLCSNIQINKSQFNNTFGESDRVIRSAEFDGSNSILFNEVQFNNPRGGDASGTIECLHLSDFPSQEFDGYGLKFVNCQFNNATRASKGAPAVSARPYVLGIRIISCKSVIFDNCESLGHNTEIPSYLAAGYDIVSASADPATTELAAIRNFTWKNCLVSDLAAPSGVTGYFFGSDFLSPDGTVTDNANPIFENCICERLRSSSSTELVSGIRIGITRELISKGNPPNTLVNAYLKNCRISDIKGGTNDSAGIHMESVKRPVIVETNITDCPNGIVFTGSNAENPPGSGIIPGFTDFGLVQNNSITNCALAGIRDDRCPTSSAFVTNTAFNNGKCLSDNYKINWGGEAPVCKQPTSNITECPRPFNLSLTFKEKKRHGKKS